MSFLRRKTRGYRPEPQDILLAALLLAFASFSFLWPMTGILEIGGRDIQRGYILGAFYLFLAILALGLGRVNTRDLPPFLRFARTFYPQALFGPLFGEAILLSGPAGGGGSFDVFFARADNLLFGYQPARRFAAAFADSVAMNELMFAGYFLFFVILVITPWISWFKGRKEESRREMCVLSSYMLLVYIFYVFFRVMGPKYWLPDLHAAWYSSFKGSAFTYFFLEVFSRASLSGAAFPSSHVAVSIMMTVFLSRTERRLLPLWIAATVLICTSTVYIYAHWFTDVIGGVVAIAILLPLFEAGRRPLRRLCTRLGRAYDAQPHRQGGGTMKEGR